jgi:hypothetical protein
MEVIHRLLCLGAIVDDKPVPSQVVPARKHSRSR